MKIDFHVHCYPDELARAAIGRRTLSAPNLPDGTSADLMRELETYGIDQAVVLHVAHKPTSTHGVNRFAAQLQETGKGRLYCFGSIHPDAPDALQALEELKRLKLCGVKFHPMFQGFFPDHPRYYELYEEIGRMELPVVFHCGKHKGIPIVLQPAQLEQMLPHFGKAPVIAAHLGGLQGSLEQLPLLSQLPVYVDIAYCAHYFTDREMETILTALPEDRILFGSDSPWDTIGAQLAQMDRISMPQKMRHKIMYQNAAKILKLK